MSSHAAALITYRFGEVWRRALAAAEISSAPTFHDLRHFYASLLIRPWRVGEVVQLRLGHASAVEMLNTYSHLWPDSEDRTRVAADAVLGADAATAATTGAGR